MASDLQLTRKLATDVQRSQSLGPFFALARDFYVHFLALQSQQNKFDTLSSARHTNQTLVNQQ